MPSRISAIKADLYPDAVSEFTWNCESIIYIEVEVL
jgi:hypothetical protein